jgi:IstB-like ATP binding protein
MAPLSETLKTLGLHHTATHLDDLVALATKRRWSPIQLLEHLGATEQQERTRHSLERRLARARIGRFTPMSDFDWAGRRASIAPRSRPSCVWTSSRPVAILCSSPRRAWAKP